MTLETAFGQVIRDFRKAKKLSQEKLAFESGLDRTFISLLECGRKQPSLVTIFQLAKALQIPPSRIIASVEEKCNENSQD
ncbi:MAG: helix-turn-helix domain-containing protein [Geobacteraceae bacterium]|nr:helix-turn-helix domain-containing protein [Geobacteraceae bacterium]